MTGQKTPFLAIFDQNTQKLIYPINYNSSHKLLFIPFDKVNGMNGPGYYFGFSFEKNIFSIVSRNSNKFEL